MALRISIFLSIFMTVHGDTIRLTATSTKQSYIFYAAPTDRIIITAAMTEQLVRLGIQSTYNLSDEDCATSAVNVTSGEASLYLGSYCGKQTPDWFYASHNTATIVFRSSKVAEGLGRINVTYDIQSVHGDTIRLTATSTKQSYIFYAAPTDRIIITAAMTEQLVRLGIQSTYNLSDEDCATSAVNVTSGEASLYLGSYCGKQTPDWFYASHNTATIVFRSSKVAEGLGRINVTYDIQSAYICGGGMSAYQRPRFIRSPQYPLRGTPFRVQRCIWVMAGLNNERVSITVKSATFSTIDCSTFNVTIFDGEEGTSDTRTLGAWCGGAGKTFFSYWRILYILAAGQRHLPAGFEIEYTAIPDPQRPIVNISLEQKATPEVIMSPGPLKIYSEFEELRWLGHAQQPVVVNITVLNASMEHTQDCDTDSIRIHLDSNPAQAAIGLGWCGGDLPSYEVFTSRLMVVFRAYPSTETHKGFSLQYSILDTPTCGGNLTATESVKHLMTPNYPGPYQGHQKCQWLIRTTDPMKMVKLTFTTTVLISNCISESVRMYDGTNEQAREIGYRCRYNRQNDNTYRSESRFMLIVFTSIIDNKDRSGFKASYVEESCGYALDAVRGKRIVLNSPGYPGNYSSFSGGNCTWTIAGRAVALRFIDMNIPCSGDSITFSDRGSTELKRKWEICGNKAHNYITIGNSMSINFVTTTGRGAGFKLTYERLTSMYGCAGDVRQVAVTSHKRTIRSVGYPTGYFDDLHCRWHFKTRYGGIEINFTIADINRDGSTCTDAIRVYDGSNTTARLLMERCSPGNFSLKSTGRSLYVEFVTDSVNVGSGFVMRCSSFKVQKTSQTDNKTTYIAVGCLIGAVIIVVIVCFVACSSKRRRGNLRRRTVFQSQGMHTPAPSAATGTASTPAYLQVYPFPPSFSNPSPPSYSEIGPKLDGMNAFDLPPSYSVVMNQGATNVHGHIQNPSPAVLGGTGESMHM